MKNTLITSVPLSLSLLFSQLVHAHPGHDHNHWTSEPIHILTMVAIAALVVSGLVYKKMTRRAKKLQCEDSHHDA